MIAALREAPRASARLGLDEAAQRRGEVGLAEDLAGARRFARLAGVRQQHAGRVRPLFQQVLVALDQVRGLRFDRITIGQRDRRCEHLGQ
jgi:hypothetical protein